MTSFRANYLTRLPLPLGSVWLLTDVAEAKGRQDLYTRQDRGVIVAPLPPFQGLRVLWGLRSWGWRPRLHAVGPSGLRNEGTVSKKRVLMRVAREEKRVVPP